MATLTPSQQFERELEVFRQEASTGTQCLYAYLAINATGSEYREVHRFLNRSALFWMTTVGALQATAIVVLGRIFDPDPAAHSVHRLLSLCLQHSAIFSTAELGKRKQGTASVAPDWWADYEKDVYVPTLADFQRLKGNVSKWRAIYDRGYRDLRRKYFAHKQALDPEAIDAMFGKTRLSELQRLYSNLMALHLALQDLYVNGTKPKLRPRRYSIAAMRRKPSPNNRWSGLPERLAHETEALLHSAASAAPVAVRRDTGLFVPRAARGKSRP